MARTSSLVAEAAPCCTACGSKNIVKTGKNVCDHQQFRCQECKAYLVLHPKSPETAPERKEEVLRAVATERLSLRAAQRVFGVDRHTISRWLKKAQGLPPVSATLLPAEKGNVLELDELWSFVGSKANPRWIWIALCRKTRQVVAYFVGDRSVKAAHALREHIPPEYRRRDTRSDFWLAHAEVFPRRTHRLCDKGEGKTCYVERWNCTLRQRLVRFVSKTLSFSKCDRMHELALRLFIPRV